MVKGQDVIMAENLESKLDAIINPPATLSYRTAKIEGIMVKLHNNGAPRIAQPRIHQSQTMAPKKAVLPPIRQDPMVQ